MTKIYEIKELFVGLYKKFETFINPIGRFLVAFIIVTRLNSYFAYSPYLNKLIINVGAALLAAFLPASWFILLLMAMVGLQLFAVSIEATIIVVLMMLVVYLLFGRVVPDYTWIIIVTPLLASMGLSYLIPLFIGLFIGPVGIIPMIAGVMVYRYSSLIPGIMDIRYPDAGMFDLPEILIEMYKYVLTAVSRDKGTLLIIIVFSVVVILMYYVSKLEFNYIYYISIGLGGLVMILLFIIGLAVLETDLSIIATIFGSLLSVILIAGCQFMRFSLDYQRSEKLQFEDDEYMYYVKAIPKVKISRTVKKIKRIK